DASLYPLSAVYAAAYVFLDRYFVLLDRPSGGHLHVALAWKKGEPPEGALRAAAGEFANELLSCAWRAKIADDNRAVIEQATAQALAGAMGAPTLDDLESFDFGSEAFDDPLGIAMSWEEKYGKNKKNEDEGKPGDRPPPESP
ncbi:MAG: hypothetical protein FWD17_15545, partial [Polyangiaceae bacterium]|nr:hypothetical protein [Polyangiaceae bacterium]